MRSGRPKSELVLSEQERTQLEAMVRSRSLPAGLVRRARIVLQAADGETNTAIAKRLKLSGATVGKWRARFAALRIQGLDDELRPGRCIPSLRRARTGAYAALRGLPRSHRRCSRRYDGT
jgi:putative transposase